MVLEIIQNLMLRLQLHLRIKRLLFPTSFGVITSMIRIADILPLVQPASFTA